MGEFAEILERIDRLATRADGRHADAALLAEIEDVLAVGYMQALTGEARSRRLATRLAGLVETLDEPGASVEARRLAVQRRTIDQKVSALRSELNVMREQFVRLGGGQRAPS